jgi:hypothetical protein
MTASSSRDVSRAYPEPVGFTKHACTCGHLPGHHLTYDESCAAGGCRCKQYRDTTLSPPYRSGPIPCNACKTLLEFGASTTICDVATGEPVYWCQDCWRQINHPARQRRVARARQRRILELLDG